MTEVDPHYILGEKRLLWDIGVLVTAYKYNSDNAKTHAIIIDREAEDADRDNDYSQLLPHDNLHKWRTICYNSKPAIRSYTGRLSALTCIDCLRVMVECLEIGQMQGWTLEKAVEITV